MKMRHIIFAFAMMGAIIMVSQQGCERSEGLKYGTLQKVSHKTMPCSYYVAEFSYEGGRAEGTDKSQAYSNTQSVEVDKVAFDSLQNYLGDKVIFDYKDVGTVFCGESKKLTSIRRKSNE